jgi:3alpha(or 20beta)-hydroxysteroid dehydrogenase
MISLDGTVAIVTGGARGQGRATGHAFLDAGAAAVYLTDVIAAEDPPAAAVFLHHDVSLQANWDAVVERVLADHGRIDILVNNAAVCPWVTMQETSLELWTRTIAINQTGPFLGMRAVAPAMIAQGSGSIINISSVGGLSGSSPTYAYGATKWALRGMTRGAAQELGPSGVRVNAVLPGVIDSEMVADLNKDAMLPGIPLRRIGQPADVARLTLWLASDESAYCSGADFLMDGGMKA